MPVLRDADRMSFADIERKIREYVQQVQDGSLSLEDLRGARSRSPMAAFSEAC